MKKFFQELKAEFRSFTGFIYYNKELVWTTILLAILSFGILLCNYQDILTDSELYIMSPEGMMDTYNRVGRFGLTLTKKLFFTNGYTPFQFIMYMMITMCLLCLFFDFCMCKILYNNSWTGKLESHFWVCLIFNAVYMTCPVLPHQFYFIYQAFEVSAAFLFCVIAAFCAFQFIYEQKSPVWGVLSIGFMVWAFATYQVLVPYYISLNAMFFFLYYLFGKKQGKNMLIICIQVIALFLTGLAAYFLINKGIFLLKYSFAPKNQLMDTYVEWGRQGVRQCLQNIKGDFRRVLFQESPAYSRIPLPIMSLFLVLSLFYGWKTRKKSFYLFVASAACIILSIFFMTIFIGSYLIIRAQLVYPLVFAFCSAVLVILPYSKKILVYAITIVMLFSAAGQLKTTQRLYTAIHLTAEEDKTMARQIYMETAKYRDPQNPGATPMIFIGGKPAVEIPTNQLSCDAIGMSFFYINYVDVQGTYRIYKFMNALGLQTAEPHIEQYEYGRQIAGDMSCWPSEGSVRYENGIIFVKLSDLDPL